MGLKRGVRERKTVYSSKRCTESYNYNFTRGSAIITAVQPKLLPLNLHSEGYEAQRQ